MLDRNQSILVVVDVQGQLAQLMHEKQALFANLKSVIRGIRALDIPILWAEQNPRGLGPTIPEIAGELDGLEPIAKVSFSCWQTKAFADALAAAGRRQVLVAGIEAHVCVYQTAMDLAAAGYEVEVVADAVSSRKAENKALALQKLQGAGVKITSVEMALFELLKVAEGKPFKNILQIVK
ncbi:MAG: isochorismatase [Deltaproteobacteria bacterium SG8_13]|nr:MAG: isochorismatase [Deltaproteobacteria bacterium SG8_13]